MTSRTCFVMKADRSGDVPTPGLTLYASQSVEAATRGMTSELTVAAMERDAKEIVDALRVTLPQGTWARIVAIVARTWADDQSGLLPEHRMGRFGQPPDVPLAVTYLRNALDEMDPRAPGKDGILSALLFLGSPVKED